MVQVKFTKKCEQFKKGQIVKLDNNTAHTFIDKGVAHLYQECIVTPDIVAAGTGVKSYANKMMITKKEK